jgi:hypothetical protein
MYNLGSLPPSQYSSLSCWIYVGACYIKYKLLIFNTSIIYLVAFYALTPSFSLLHFQSLLKVKYSRSFCKNQKDNYFVQYFTLRNFKNIYDLLERYFWNCRN